MPKPFKIPLSVLVVIHTPTLDVLLINRADTPGTWQSVTTRLDAIAKRYADVVRGQPDNDDAAYNYEFIVRLRAAVAAAKQAIAPRDLNTTGLTIHGHAGGPPEGSDTKKFKMIVPMRPDERMEAEQAGRGAQKTRKG